MIYDEESDRHVHIPFDQALFATCYGYEGENGGKGPKGDLFGLETSFSNEDVVKKFTKSLLSVQEKQTEVVMPVVDNTLYKGTGETTPEDLTLPTGETLDATAQNWVALMKRLGEKAKAGTDNAQRRIVAVLLAMVQAGVWLPVEIVIARPFIEHLMLSAIVTVAGRDTGATLFGPADMQISVSFNTRTLAHNHRKTPDPLLYSLSRRPTPPSRPSRAITRTFMQCLEPTEYHQAVDFRLLGQLFSVA